MHACHAETKKNYTVNTRLAIVHMSKRCPDVPLSAIFQAIVYLYTVSGLVAEYDRKVVFHLMGTHKRRN